jgi:predicted DNA-binding transcriptional regulator YafY
MSKDHNGHGFDTALCRLCQTDEVNEGVPMEASRPASRILSMLELLQDRPGITGPQIAERLGVSGRTVRRYVGALQEMGIPIEPTPGRYGGYRLFSGFRLPPLMFSADEAIGLVLAIIAARPHGITSVDHPAERAISKIERVLSPDLARKLNDVREGVIVPSGLWDAGAVFPDPDVLTVLTQASLTDHRIWMRYGRPDGDESAREVEPYGVVALFGRWYLHGWCHLREARRTFRVDRIRRADLLPATFERPEGIDVLAAVESSLALSRGSRVRVRVHAPIGQVRRCVPRVLAVLEPDGDDWTMLLASSDEMEWFAWRLLDVPFDIEVLEPAELRDAFRRIGERALAIAERG